MLSTGRPRIRFLRNRHKFECRLQGLAAVAMASPCFREVRCWYRAGIASGTHITIISIDIALTLFIGVRAVLMHKDHALHSRVRRLPLDQWQYQS